MNCTNQISLSWTNKNTLVKGQKHNLKEICWKHKHRLSYSSALGKTQMCFFVHFVSICLCVFVSSAMWNLPTAVKMQEQNLGFTLTSHLWPLPFLSRDFTVLGLNTARIHWSNMERGILGNESQSKGGHRRCFYCLLQQARLCLLCVCSHETGLGHTVVWSAANKPMWLNLWSNKG